MARLAAVEKGEYYPTPLSIVDQVVSYLAPTRGQRGLIRLVDPCCGSGLALESLAKAVARRTNLPVQTWGVEISPDRAEEAATRLDLVLQAPFEAVSWSPVRHGVASLVFLNPPYDQDGHGGRMELQFLKAAMPALVTGGVLVYVIPATAVGYGMTEYLYTHFEDVRVFRFGNSDDESGFDRFKQLVVLATRRKQSLKSLYADETARREADQFLETCDEYYCRRSHGQTPKEVLPIALPEGTAYAVPIARKGATLRRHRWLDDEMEGLVERGWASVEDQIVETLLATDAELPQPLVPPKTGHIAQIVAAGLAGLIESDGQVFKGRCVKVTEVTPDPEDPSKEIARDRYETHVVKVSAQGLDHLSQPAAVESFLQRHIKTFKQYIGERFKPYGNTITAAENSVLDTLSLDKQLPGVSERGLLPKQREVAVALTRAVERYGVGHLVGEMGFGKTRTSLASVELMDAYPVLVICPPHLVDKWKREAESAVPGLEAHIVESITELVELRERYKPGQKLVVIVSRSKIKLGSGWKRVHVTRRTLSDDEREREQFSAAVQRYKEARNALRGLDDLGADRETLDQQRRIAAQARREALNVAIPVSVCPDCGTPLSRKSLKSRSPWLCTGTVEVWNQEEGEVESRTCWSPLYQFGDRYHRWPLADYIRKKMPKFFKSLLADEVHQYKAKDSDQGWAFGLLAGTIPAVITLTGTFFGGPASSILWLLHRTQRSIRDDFGFSEEKRWVNRFGVLETTFKYEEDEFGHYSGKRRRRVSTKEKPGISPGVVRYTLPTTIFVSIKDLDINLPEFREEFVSFEPTGEMQQDLSRVEEFTWNQMKEYWPYYTSAWLQWNLARPNSCFRHEVIEGYAGNAVLECPPVVEEGQLLPKEEWLANTVKAELAAGRKVVVYVRQTGTRDIRARLVQVLGQAGVPGVVVLNPNVPPRQREAWLRKQRANVLITNPKLVETGLDLVQYSTVVFYEVEYSLYTLWQACRRVWRLGQVRPVKVYYLTYEGTLEEKAYALIGQKIKAAQLLYGDEVASALVEDVGDASLVMALLQAIEGDEALQLGHDAHIFGSTAEVVSNSAMGSPVYRSPAINTFEQWAAARGMTYTEARNEVGGRRCRRRSVPEQQMSMFL